MRPAQAVRWYATTCLALTLLLAWSASPAGRVPAHATEHEPTTTTSSTTTTSTTTTTLAADPCAWEWGGAQEASPEPCTSDGDPIKLLRDGTGFGLGFVVLLLAALVALYAFRRLT